VQLSRRRRHVRSDYNRLHYVGTKDDYGYNQAHAERAAGVAESFDWVKIVEEASVLETTAVEESMRSVIDIDGASVLFPMSFGYFDPPHS
jgi:basic membrane protein A